MADIALELRSLRSSYDQIEVLHGVDLVVPAGAIVTVLGPNGAGKTTMLNVIGGIQPATSGSVVLAGRDVTNAAPTDLARSGVCSIPEGRGIFPNLTVSENLWMATYSGTPRDEIEEKVFARFPRLGERRTQLAGTMSGGEQQMLALGRALTTDPALLILDELSMGLAPLVVEQMYQAVAELAADGVTVLCTEQFAETVLGIADTAAVMTHGHITRVGDPTEIRSHLAGAYFGDDPTNEGTSR